MSTICDDLRAAILQAAMQGKLTKREPNDDNAKELREEIIKEHSAFKPNKFVEKSRDEAIIPEEWSSLKSGEVFELITGKIISNGEELPLLDAKYFRGKQFSKTNKGNLANRNDVLILVDGENSGETFLCTEPGYIGSTFKGLFIPNCIVRDYALYFLEMNRKILRDNKRGAAIPHLDKKLFFNFVFPIPSLAEQKRIVKKVDELMARVADLEKSADALASLKKAFPSDIKIAILRAAMQGKLTKQLPKDGNADELLDQIISEKTKLAADRANTKKEIMSSQKKEKEKPFSIPSSWVWTHLGSITINLDCFRVPIEKKIRAKQKNKEFDYYGASGVIDKVDSFIFKKRLLLIGEDGANLLTRSKPIAFIASGKYWVNNHAHVLDVGEHLSLEYLCYYINSIDLSYYVTGTAQPKMNQANMNSIWVPIPPLAEQQRIVRHLDVLMQNINVIEDLITSE